MTAGPDGIRDPDVVERVLAQREEGTVLRQQAVLFRTSHHSTNLEIELTRRNIPFAFVSGYGRESLPRAFRNAAVLSKPFSPEGLLEAATRLVQPAADVVRLRD